jgi:hypothetical protein
VRPSVFQAEAVDERVGAEEALGVHEGDAQGVAGVPTLEGRVDQGVEVPDAGRTPTDPDCLQARDAGVVGARQRERHRRAAVSSGARLTADRRVRWSPGAARHPVDCQLVHEQPVDAAVVLVLRCGGQGQARARTAGTAWTQRLPFGAAARAARDRREVRADEREVRRTRRA